MLYIFYVVCLLFSDSMSFNVKSTIRNILKFLVCYVQDIMSLALVAQNDGTMLASLPEHRDLYIVCNCRLVVVCVGAVEPGRSR